jgi:predicted neutral ceramidase superfamily lipid hydrolase
MSGLAASPFDPPTVPMRRDKWLFWPVVASLMLVTPRCFLCTLPALLRFVLVPLAALTLLYSVMILAITSFVAAVRQRFRKSASIALAAPAQILL